MDVNETIYAAMPLCRTLGIVTRTWQADLVEMELAWDAALCTTAGLMHGGAVMALADSAGGACAAANLPEGATGTSTIESKTNFLGAVRDGVVTATARPLHVGSTTIVVETEVRRADGRLVAKTTQTQAVLRLADARAEPGRTAGRTASGSSWPTPRAGFIRKLGLVAQDLAAGDRHLVHLVGAVGDAQRALRRRTSRRAACTG